MGRFFLIIRESLYLQACLSGIPGSLENLDLVHLSRWAESALSRAREFWTQF